MGLVLGQIKTTAKSNEITAIPELLDALDIEGATITLDAMGCQRAILDKIVGKEAHYIAAVKNNQEALAQSVESVFSSAKIDVASGKLLEDISIDKGHGRLETRRCVVAHAASEILGVVGKAWPSIKSVVMIESSLEFINGRNKGHSSTEWRYYVSDLEIDASQFNAQIRGHWSIENNCHWVLNVAFNEDACRIREGHGAQNFAILRRIALNLSQQEKSTQKSMNRKRRLAAWDPTYLQTLLGLQPMPLP